MHTKLIEDLKAINADVYPYLSKLLDELEANHPYIYKDEIEKLSILVYGYHFTESTLKEAVDSMINANGTTGGKWIVEETNTVSGIDFTTKSYNQFDFNYVMNMAHSDYADLLGTDVNNYIKFSRLFLEDVDGQEGKAYSYYINIVKA